MPQIDTTAPTLESILAFQRKTGLSDKEMGLILIGDTSDPAAHIRAWKSGSKEPSRANLLAFHYLSALVRIADLNPLDGEEIYSIAHSALPLSLK